MATALHIAQGAFGPVALLDMKHSLVTHAHPHCHVLVKMAGADSAFQVRDTLCPLTDDSVVVVNAWEPHAYVHTPAHTGTIILALYIEPAWLAGFERILVYSGRPDFFPAPLGSMDRNMREAAEALADAISSPAHEETRNDLLVELMLAVAERFSGRRANGMSIRNEKFLVGDFRVRKAVAYMRSSIGRQFNLNEVARESGLSRSHLFQLFQENLQLSPHLYFNALRVELAVTRLALGREQISTLSSALGFSMQSHFTRFMRNNIGVCPSEYRRSVTLADGPKEVAYHL